MRTIEVLCNPEAYCSIASCKSRPVNLEQRVRVALNADCSFSGAKMVNSFGLPTCTSASQPMKLETPK